MRIKDLSIYYIIKKNATNGYKTIALKWRSFISSVQLKMIYAIW